MTASCSILGDYAPEAEFAVANKINQRTVARYRQQGLPYQVWGGVVYIDLKGAREWFVTRTKRLNQPREQRI
jgi:hypothetical protein